jgi:hypothetical protein
MKKDDFNKIGIKMMGDINNTNDPISLTILCHLYSEYWINQIIEEKSPTAKEILDNRNFTFSIKLVLVYNMGFITEVIYSNIKILNNLRNKIAHQLDYDLNNFDFNQFKYDHVLDKDTVKTFDLVRKLKFVGSLTYGMIHTHCLEYVWSEE